jgi:hypothetical protein
MDDLRVYMGTAGQLSQLIKIVECLTTDIKNGILGDLMSDT